MPQVISSAELSELIATLLVREDSAMTLTQLRQNIPKAVRPPAAEVKKAVESLVAAGKAFRVGRRYSGTPDRSLHDAVLLALSDSAMTITDVARKTRTAARRVRDLITELIEHGSIHQYPKQGRSLRFGLRPPGPLDLIAPELEKLFATAKKLGLDQEQATAALRKLLGEDLPRSDGSDERILQAMLRLNPGAGALIYLPHLRTAVAGEFPLKDAFDAAVLSLLARGRIQLQSHPTPSVLSTRERESMVEDGRGSYYTAVSLR